MGKLDRAYLINRITKPNSISMIDTIIDKHYKKFCTLYEIIDYIDDEQGKIAKYHLTDIDSCLGLDIFLKSKKKADIVMELLDSYIHQKSMCDGITVDINKVSSTSINISINTIFIEEDIYK